MSHHIVFYAPLWGEDEGGVHAAANEQQAIGRVFRIGQVRDALVHISPYLPISPHISPYLGQVRDVVVHRIVAVGPKNQPTIEQLIVDRNTSEDVTRQAVIA